MTYQLSADQIRRVQTDRMTWVRAAGVKIEKRKTLELVAFEPNRVQDAIYARMDAADNEGRPFLCIGLKSRRHGFSTAGPDPFLAGKKRQETRDSPLRLCPRSL